MVKNIGKYFKNKASLTGKQRQAIEDLFRAGGKALLNVLGLGTCVSLAVALGTMKR